jgi:HAD superfamily hydrolase (TIGR01509 family)
MDDKNRIEAIIFDMDGVLCDSEPFICEAAIQMLAERHGVKAAPADFAPFVGMGEDRFIGGVAEKYGARIDLESDKARTYAIYLELIRGRLQPLHGVREFIAAARARGWKLGVASSADLVKVTGNLTEIGLPPATFDAVVNGLDVTHRKPDPDIFLLAAQRIGADARRAVVVEDAPAGIRAAVAAGAAPLGITSSFSAAQLSAEGARWTARDLGEAASLIPVWAGERE